MIELENLNDQSFEDIVEAATKQIAHFSDEWTNTQESDPGITLIEMFAWLKVLQQDYLNKVTPESQNKFLKLLDIKRGRNRGARALLEVSGLEKELCIPKGTKWFVGEMDFENSRVEELISSKIKSVEIDNDGKVKKLSYEGLDGKRIFRLFEDTPDVRYIAKNADFKINFDMPISNGRKFSLYFKVFLEEKYTRNPIAPEDEFINMAQVEWEFYGEKDGELGWHKVEVLSDATHNFLFSGVVNIKLEGEMRELDGDFSIRARIIDQHYDFLPRITEIRTNVFEVVQQSTLCESTYIQKSEIEDSSSFYISSNLALYGKSKVYLKAGDSWKQTDKFTFERNVEAGNVYFYVEDLPKCLPAIKDDEAAVMVVSYDEDIEPHIVMGSGTGISSQTLPLKHQKVLYDSFDLMVGYYKDDQLLFDKWNKVDDFFSSKKYDKDYILDRENDKIIFGTHEKGQAPRRASNNIRLCGLALTEGRASNIKAGMLEGVKSQNKDILSLKINQLTPATGGLDDETFEDIKSKTTDVLNQSKKAVTIEDYEKFAKATPGLVVENVRILPSYLPKAKKPNSNSVTIVVRGGNMNNKGAVKSYEANIKKHIDKYRLITTKVEVTGPVYIGLSISGQIVVNSYYRQSADVISKSIREFVDDLNKQCGQPFSFGDLFGMIDRLECVSYVDKLHIIPIGEYIEKTMSDDIIIPPNGIYYIDKLDLSYVKSANI